MTGSDMGRPFDAVIFDVDGTLADTERDGHRPAFNTAFAVHGIDISWDEIEYGRLLRTPGGRQRIVVDLRTRGFPADRVDALAAELHATKTRIFRESVLAGEIGPRPGLPELVTALTEAGIRLAVATTGRRAWVEPLVDHILGAGTVEVTVTGDDVRRLKPHPEVYLRALEGLGITSRSALAMEDSQPGLAASVGAHLATVVVTTNYTSRQDFTGAAMVRPGYDGADPLTYETCQTAHRAWWSARQPER